MKVKTPKWGFAEVFLVSQTALPALLYLPGTQAIRLPIRIAPFAISLAAFAWWQIERTVRVPLSRTQSWLVGVMALMTLELFHPLTPSFVGGIAQMAVYFAVMAPLFWAPVFVKTPEQIARLLWLLLLCSGVNAAVGVLQVYDPQRWLPAEFSRVLTQGAGSGLGPLIFIGPNGERMVRPPGLFDTPGAVAGPGASAALLGLIFAASAMPVWKRALSLGLACAGLGAVYLSQVRISLVISILSMILYVAVSVRQQRFAKATQFSILAGAIVMAAFTLAIALGGASIQQRVMSLLTGDPIQVYQSARGVQFQVTFSQMLFDAPFGAGLGRWGMAALYFGSFTPLAQSIWAEIQFTGWVIDGGVLMVALYCGALAVAAMTQWQLITKRESPRLAQCAAVIFSANLSTAAMIFTFTPFVTQLGIQYWFLAGALHGVAARHGFEGA